MRRRQGSLQLLYIISTYMVMLLVRVLLWNLCDRRPVHTRDYIFIEKNDILFIYSIPFFTLWLRSNRVLWSDSFTNPYR